MKPIEIPALDPQQLAALENLYRTTRDVRLRTRAQMVLLATERSMRPQQRSPRSSVQARRRCVAGSSATWLRGSRGCAMCRIRVRRGEPFEPGLICYYQVV